MITRRSVLILPVAALLSAQSGSEVTLPADGDFPASLPFRIVPITGGSDTETLALMARYGEGQDQTKFLIEIQGPRKKDGSADLDTPVSFSHGEFRHVTSSRPAQFFEQLANALAADSPTFSAAKQETLPFDIAFLGPPTTRLPGGGFGGAAGNWYATKLFLAEGAAEVYFNFNLESGEAEFSIKDEDYGNIVLSELSKVIW
ncbi:hypothetical protein ACXHMN_25370 [Rhizobium sp. LEGMi12c]